MNLPISPRLLACCGFIRPGDRVADIGCDHGYLGIHLLRQGIAAFVIAADVNQSPLDSAYHNAYKFGVRNQMSFHLSDGARNIPREFDVMVCAGMGADTMISILTAAPWLKSPQYRLILQCQSKTHCLRQFLSEQGWQIARESVLRDGRFLYTVMEVIWQPGHTLTPGQCYLSPALLQEPSGELREYFQRVTEGLSKAVLGRGRDQVPEMAAALEELQSLAQMLEFSWLKEETP